MNLLETAACHLLHCCFLYRMPIILGRWDNGSILPTLIELIFSLSWIALRVAALSQSLETVCANRARALERVGGRRPERCRDEAKLSLPIQ